MQGDTGNQAKNMTSRMLLLEARRKMPIRDIILESYWVHRDWGGVCHDLSIGRTTLREWRIKTGVDQCTVKYYVASRMQDPLRLAPALPSAMIR